MPVNSQVDSPLSIGYLSPGWPRDGFPNGVVSYIADMVEPLRRMGHRVTVVTSQDTSPEPDPSIYELEWARSPQGLVRRLRTWLGYRLAPETTQQGVFRGLLLAAVDRAIAERGVQLFEIEETFGHALWIRRRTSIPICVRLHGPWFLNGRAEGIREDRAFRRRVVDEGRALAAADAVTAPSHDVLERTRTFYGLALPRAEVIPNPTQPVPATQRWRPDGCDPKEVLFIGRFDRHKGGDLIIDAFDRVLREIPDARLRFVGPDPGFLASDGRTWNIEEYIRARIPNALETGRIEWLGQQPHSALARFRRRAAVTVVCSRYENFPYTALEAVAMGSPTVAADVGGIPTIVPDGICGLLHRVEDPGDLAAKILRLLKDPSHAARLGHRAAIECQRRFYPDVVAEQSVEFYRRTLSRSGTVRERPQTPIL
jgi:glycosyltransferase involved in cell wall biosynthesis